MSTSNTQLEISSAGHFDAAIRPAPHDARRIPPAHLVDFLRKHTVRMRGWPVPFMDGGQPVHRHGNWIGQEYEDGRHKEAWRLFTSGQFLHRRVLVSDLVQDQQLAADQASATGSVVVWDVLLYTVELVELAARIATDLRCDTVTVNLNLVNIEGRQLVSGDWSRELHGPYLVNSGRLLAQRLLTTTSLLADPRGIAVSLTQDLLGQFGVDVPGQVLMDWQEKTFNR
ncbi:hypothetical protein EUA06_21490 [Nocardioides glacieisoli]|uniref:Uncharacterized protein n=1 Tax=Nocardioides glacieisoli TaxID=1168730 RepID=A0A4V1RJC8_9ACTN|nr:hypothetical protein [Nocardioides glacieisoli]RYB88332.1 hypothetical protein EUA06_21490 [Nocardioides glacieisoli]